MYIVASRGADLCFVINAMSQMANMCNGMNMINVLTVMMIIRLIPGCAATGLLLSAVALSKTFSGLAERK